MNFRRLIMTGTVSAAISAGAVTEWPLDHLQIGAGYLDKENVRTEKNIREMKECGIDVLVHGHNGDVKTFDLLAKYGLTTIVNELADPVVASGTRTQRECYPQAYYEWMARKFVPHPAITGIDMGDEPPARSFEYYGELAERLSELYPGRFIYFNLYPNYASLMALGKSEADSQLGTATYDEYIEKYSKYLPLNYICYDHYLPSAPKEGRAAAEERYFANLESVVKVARRTGRKLCIWLLSGSSAWQPAPTTENQLRYQAFTSMAYGTSFICWGCYAGGWWQGQILTAEGVRTKQYECLQRVNREIKAMCPVYDRLRACNTTVVSSNALSTAAFTDVKAVDGAKLVIGEFTGKLRSDPWQALFIAAADDPWDEIRAERQVRLTTKEKVRVITNTGERTARPDASGSILLRLPPSGAALVVTEASRSDRENDRPSPFRKVNTTVLNHSKYGGAMVFYNGYFQEVRTTDRSCLRIVDLVAEDESEHRRALLVGMDASSGERPCEVRFKAYGTITVTVGNRAVEPVRGLGGEYRLKLDKGERALIECRNR